MKYAKFAVALVGAVAETLSTTFAADTTVGRIVSIVLAVATALGVYLVPNATGSSGDVSVKSGPSPY